MALASYVVACAAAGGCGTKITNDTLAKVKTGMSRGDVEGLLGAGKVEDGVTLPDLPGITGKKEVWQDGGKTITVYFADEIVVGPPQQQGP